MTPYNNCLMTHLSLDLILVSSPEVLNLAVLDRRDREGIQAKGAWSKGFLACSGKLGLQQGHTTA